MKILVTGANGFIGTSLVEQLSLLNHKVEMLTRSDKVETYTDTKFNGVINCAASIHNENLDQMYEDNVLLTYNLLTKLKYDHFIQIGSSSEYGSTEKMMSIKDCPDPATSYEGTKAAATMLALGVGKSLGKKVSVVRPFSVYGPGITKRSFLQTLTKALAYDEPYAIYDGAHDWIYIDDFVEGLIRILELKLDGIFNLCSGKSLSNKDTAGVIANVLGKPTNNLQITNKKYRIYDKESWYGNSKETAQLLGWETKTTLHAGLTKCIKNWT